MHSYKNKFYNAKVQESKPVLFSDSDPEIYRGFQIFERIKNIVYDIVKDGECIGMYAGRNGAKKYIDKKLF